MVFFISFLVKATIVTLMLVANIFGFFLDFLIIFTQVPIEISFDWVFMKKNEIIRTLQDTTITGWKNASPTSQDSAPPVVLSNLEMARHQEPARTQTNRHMQVHLQGQVWPNLCQSVSLRTRRGSSNSSRASSTISKLSHCRLWRLKTNQNLL